MLVEPCSECTEPPRLWDVLLVVLVAVAVLVQGTVVSVELGEVAVP